MRKTKYPVRLSRKKRSALLRIVSTGTRSARVINHARILLMAHEGMVNRIIAQTLSITSMTVYAVRRRFQTEGLGCLYDRPRPGKPRKLNGKAEARLTAIACSEPPEGHARWSVRLLADRLVQLEVVDTISHKTVWETLKKRAQTVAETPVVHCASNWRVPGTDGRTP
jgi:putative transposase